MSLFAAEIKLPQLLVAFLEARRLDPDHPMPAAELLPIFSGPGKSADKRPYPSIAIWCPGFELHERRDQEKVDVVIDLHTSDETDQVTEDGWLAALRRAFSGGPSSANANAADASTNPLMAYLGGLSLEERTGWALTDFHLTGGGNTVSDKQRIIRRTTAQCLFRSQTFTV